jgi:hypothetical protein
MVRPHIYDRFKFVDNRGVRSDRPFNLLDFLISRNNSYRCDDFYTAL